MNQIKLEYNGPEITYNEEKDRWEFNLRNRDRFAETLGRAKEAIDKPPPEEKNQFKRVECWIRDYNGWEKVTVTSIAEMGYSNTAYLWVVDPRKNRAKQRNTALFPCTFANDQTVSKIVELEQEAKELPDQIDKLHNTMTHLIVEPEEES